MSRFGYRSEEYVASEEYRKEQNRRDNLYDGDGNIYSSAINDAFLAGIEWAQNKMMREAVESGMTVGYINRKLWDVPEDYKVVFCKDGDNVKLIIVKEE